MENRIFLATAGTDPKTAAGPIILQAAVFDNPTFSDYTWRIFRRGYWCESDFRRSVIEEESRDLSQSGAIKTDFKFLDCADIYTGVGMNQDLICKEAHDLAARLEVVLGLNEPEVTVVGKGVEGYIGFPKRRIAKRQASDIREFLVMLYARWHFHDWMRYHFHALAPIYDWETNLGAATAPHVRTVYQQGPKVPIHRLPFIFRLGRRIYRWLEKEDPWALLHAKVESPDWWIDRFPDVYFYWQLNRAQRDYLLHRQSIAMYPLSFQRWMAEHPPPSLLNTPFPKRTTYRRFQKVFQEGSKIGT